MNEHILTISQPASKIPSTGLPDGAITGNGDVVAILGGSADRVKIHIGKSDFWKADCRVYTDYRGGLSPLGIVEILFPHLAYADYKVEQNIVTSGRDHIRELREQDLNDKHYISLFDSSLSPY